MAVHIVRLRSGGTGISKGKILVWRVPRRKGGCYVCCVGNVTDLRKTLDEDRHVTFHQVNEIGGLNVAEVVRF